VLLGFIGVPGESEFGVIYLSLSLLNPNVNERTHKRRQADSHIGGEGIYLDGSLNDGGTGEY
jgi:hypothetical protein